MDRQCHKVSRGRGWTHECGRKWPRGQGGWTWLDTRVWEKMAKGAGRVDMAGHTSVGENGQGGREGGHGWTHECGRKWPRGQGGWTWLDKQVWEKMAKEGREDGHSWTHECGRKWPKKAGRVDMAGHTSVGENGRRGQGGWRSSNRGWNRSSKGLGEEKDRFSRTTCSRRKSRRILSAHSRRTAASLGTGASLLLSSRRTRSNWRPMFLRTEAEVTSQVS